MGCGSDKKWCTHALESKTGLGVKRGALWDECAIYSLCQAIENFKMKFQLLQKLQRNTIYTVLILFILYHTNIQKSNT